MVIASQWLLNDGENKLKMTERFWRPIYRVRGWQYVKPNLLEAYTDSTPYSKNTL